MDPQAQILEEVAKVEAEADRIVGVVDVSAMSAEVEAAKSRLREYTMEGGTIPNIPYGGGRQIGPGGALPLADLRERVAILTAAGVESYEDGPLRLRFSSDLRPGRGPDKREPQF